MSEDLDARELETETQLGPDPGRLLGPGRAYLLVQTAGQLTVTEVPRGARVVLGRGRECDVLLDDSKASREHCAVERRADGLFVQDLRSHNGTWLRGHRLPHAEPTALSAGDQLSVGAVTIAVAMASSTTDATESAPTEVDGVLELGEAIVADPATVAVYRKARRVAATNATVLLHGETGSGKEVLAEQIHRFSPRAGRPFVRINCAAVPESLLESELFGHERGAFTGADRRREGLFEAASGGTLLLDEIGEVTLPVQAKLLRALETKTIQPLGTNRSVGVDVRILCATNRDLEARAKAGEFREDLFYRVGAFVLTLPPLRERPAEIALLAERFIAAFAAREGLRASRLKPDTLATLLAYRWPGNVRELRNVVEHAVVMADGAEIEKKHLPDRLGSSPSRAPSRTSPLGVREELEELERDRIEGALAAHGGNRTRAAQALGMSRRALIYKLHKHGLG